MHSRQTLLLLIVGGLALPGCSVIPGPTEMVTRIGYFIECVSDENALEMERRRLDVESQRKQIKLERQAMQTAAVDESQATRKSFEDSVRTKIGLNVDYDLQIGEPEIDVDSLKVSMQQFETELIAYNQRMEAIRKREEMDLKLATEADVRAIMDGPDGAAHVGYWTKDWLKKDKCVPDCAAPNQATVKPPSQATEKGPPAPKFGQLKMNVPITVRIGGNGDVEDSMTRRIPDESEATEKQPCVPKCAPCAPTCKAPGKMFSGIPMPQSLQRVFAEDTPDFDEDEPDFEDTRPQTLVPPPFEAAAELPADIRTR